MTALTPYLIGLMPLLLAITGLAILPIGLHYADKERAEREARDTTLQIWSTLSTAIHIPASTYRSSIYTAWPIIERGVWQQPQQLVALSGKAAPKPKSAAPGRQPIAEAA